MSLKDKVAIVTGAASGIGKEIARQFLAEGAKVAIADINIEAAQATAAEFDPSGASTFGVAMDVTDEGQVEAMVMRARQAYGGVDVLVNNAGILGGAGVLDMDLARWQALFKFSQNKARELQMSWQLPRVGRTIPFANGRKATAKSAASIIQSA